MKFEEIIEEQNDSALLKTSKNKPLVDAIVNRHPITFYYSGPRKPKKKSVKAGYRVKAEPVALGAHKSTGNLIVRAYIDDPSASKRGTPSKVGKEKANYGWRTFLYLFDNPSFSINFLAPLTKSISNVSFNEICGIGLSIYAFLMASGNLEF